MRLPCMYLSEQFIGGVPIRQTKRSTSRSALASWQTSSPHCADFLLQLVDFNHTWCQRGDSDIHIFDVLPLTADVHIFIKTDPWWAQQPRYPCPLTNLLSAVGELFARRQLRNAPTLDTAWTTQQITRAEFHTFEVLNYEVATSTPAAWNDLRTALLSLGRTTTPPVVLADGAHLVAEACVRALLQREFQGRQIGASASFIPVVFWICLELIAARQRRHRSPSLPKDDQKSQEYFVHFPSMLLQQAVLVLC